MDPIIIVNAKAYRRGVGEAALALARHCEQRGAWLCVQATDIAHCAATGVRVLAQHVDPVTYGSHTGSVLPEAARDAGAWGTLLNHAEKRLSDDVIRSTAARCKEAGLAVVLCAASVEDAERLQDVEPEFFAIELPELIGGDVSIVSADPAIVTRAVERLGDNVLIGAGISSSADVERSMELGAKGVLLASAVVNKPEDQRAALDALYTRT